MENLNAVRKKYFEAFELLKSQENIFITDGNRDAKEVAEDISDAVNQLL